MQAKVIHNTASPPSQNPFPMGIIHHQHRAEFVFEGNEFCKPRQVPIHAEYPVCHDQAALGGFRIGQKPAQGGDIIMRVADKPRPGEERTIYDARMIEAVGEDDMPPAGKGRDDTGIDRIA